MQDAGTQAIQETNTSTQTESLTPALAKSFCIRYIITTL
jgi:hypothetical protein